MKIVIKVMKSKTLSCHYVTISIKLSFRIQQILPLEVLFTVVLYASHSNDY